jgi:hypothetical protein
MTVNNDVKFIQTVDNTTVKTEDLSTTTVTMGSTLPVPNGGWWVIMAGKEPEKQPMSYHPCIPVRIDANEKERIVVVTWDDGEKTKVTCDSDDSFSVDAGFAQALKYKIFGGKTQYKEKWLRIIARRVKLHGVEPKIFESKSKQAKKK